MRNGKAHPSEVSEILSLAKDAFQAQSTPLDQDRQELFRLIVEKMQPGSRPRKDLIETIKTVSSEELPLLIEEYRSKPTPTAFNKVTTHTQPLYKAPHIEHRKNDSFSLSGTIVTEDGKIGSPPLQVYHGTIADFNEYKPGRGSRGQASDTKGAIFFTSSPEAAAYHTTVSKGIIHGPNPRGANIRPAYLNIKEPFIVNLSGGHKDPQRVANWISEAKRLKFDGVIIKNVIDAEIGEAADVYVVFNNQQIVSSIQYRAEHPQSLPVVTDNPRSPTLQQSSRRPHLKTRP
jgi:hypothetical protein